jgi:hypothetical protein
MSRSAVRGDFAAFCAKRHPTMAPTEKRSRSIARRRQNDGPSTLRVPRYRKPRLIAEPGPRTSARTFSICPSAGRVSRQSASPDRTVARAGAGVFGRSWATIGEVESWRCERAAPAMRSPPTPCPFSHTLPAAPGSAPHLHACDGSEFSACQMVMLSPARASAAMTIAAAQTTMVIV